MFNPLYSHFIPLHEHDEYTYLLIHGLVHVEAPHYELSVSLLVVRFDSSFAIVLQIEGASFEVSRVGVQEHLWSSGRIHGCHPCDPGSIPGRCTLFPPYFSFLGFDENKLRT